MRSVIRLYLTVFVISLVASCRNSDGATGDIVAEWQSDCSEYRMPDIKCVYRLPDKERFIVAAPEGLPDGVKMCIVDTVSNNSVSIFTLTNNSTDSISPSSAQLAVNEVVRQSPDVKSTITTNSLKHDEFMSTKAWKFKTGIRLDINNDTMAVFYAGYIFPRTRAVAFVITTQKPYASLDSIVGYYAGGLRPLND